METFKISDDILAELARLNELARTGTAGLPAPKFLADFVKLQRCMRQWKQETLASFAGVSLTTIERIERAEVVSRESLDRVAIALGYKAGDFTEPRVPLSHDQLVQKLDDSLAVFADRVAVPVRPLRTQSQVVALARCHCYLVDGSHIGIKYEPDIANIREWLDLTAFIIAQDNNSSYGGERPVRRRELYTDVLEAVQDVERQADAVALSGTYTTKTNAAAVPTTNIAVIAFFPRRTDPGAVKRKVLLAPESLDLRAASQTFCDEV